MSASAGTAGTSGWGGRLLPAAAAALLLGWLSGGGCSDSTVPDPPPRVTFAPAADTLRVPVGATVVFAVAVENLGDPQIAFWRDDQYIGDSATRSLFFGAVATVAVKAVVTGEGRTWERVWIVVIGESDHPPVALNLLLQDGPPPSTVTLTWRRPTGAWPLPLAHYQVAVRSGSPPGETGWAERVIAVLPVGPQVETRRFGFADSPLIVPDAVLFFGIRVVDEAGAIGPVAAAGPWRVRKSWSIDGVLTDDAGLPLAGVSLDYGCDTCRVFTAADGVFRGGPFSEDAAFSLRTLADSRSFFNFLIPQVTIASAQPLRIGLIRPRPLLAACAESHYPGSAGFLDLLMELTRTDADAGSRTLLKWESYPVEVHVAPGTGVGGLDLAAAARTAIAQWNALLGEPCLTLVPEAPAVGIEVVVRSIPYLGLAELIEPAGSTINRAVPRKVRVSLSPDINLQDMAVSVAAHELAHALGLGEHSRCPQHLMFRGTTLTSPTAPLPEEVALMRAVIHLPQRTLMDRYQR